MRLIPRRPGSGSRSESFLGADHLRRVIEEAQAIVNDALAAAAEQDRGGAARGPHQQKVSEAKKVWRNEGDPN